MRILLSAYSCDPELGSEERSGWFLATELVKLGHDVWVLTHPRGQQSVERALAAERFPNLHIRFVEQPRLADRIIRGQSDWIFLYLLWQWQAYQAARKLAAEVEFDVVHHITWASFKGGSWMWRLGKPFLFGPLGGCQVAPHAFKHYFGDDWRRESVRAFVTSRLLPYSPLTVATVRKADLVLVTNRETLQMAEKLGARRPEYFLDSGLGDHIVPDEFPRRAAHRQFRLLWAGSLAPNKAVRMAMEAVAATPAGIPVHLTIMGDGPQASRINAWVKELDLEGRVDYRGHVPWTEVAARMDESDALLFTSLRDSSGPVVLESMGKGLPVIVLNHQGVREFVPEEAGVKVPVTTPQETVAALTGAILRLYSDPDLRLKMGRCGWMTARQQTWSRRARRFTDYYEKLAAGRSAPVPSPAH